MLENLDNDSTFGGGAYFRFLETEAGGSRGVPTAPLGAGQQPSCGITGASAEHRKPPPRPQTASGWSMGAADPTLSALSLASTQDFAQQISQQTEGILRGTGSQGSLAALAPRDVSPTLLRPQPQQPQQPQPQPQPQQPQPQPAAPPPQHVQFSTEPPTYAPSVASVPMNLLDELAKMAMHNNETPPPTALAGAPAAAGTAPLFSHDPLQATALQALTLTLTLALTLTLTLP